MSNSIGDILRFRSLIITFAIMDLKMRYRNSILGVGWSFLEPLLILSILNIVFSTILKNNIENFPIFLILNLTIYNMFTRGTSISAESILSRAGIIKSVYVSREVFPIASNLTAFFMMLIEFSIVTVFIIIFQFKPTITILFLPVPIILLLIFTLGISLALSSLNVRFRDVRIIWTVILQALFFLTPIFYKINFLPHPLSDVVRLNPLVVIMEMIQNIVLYNSLPSLVSFTYISVTAPLTLLIGWIIFKKLDHTIDERI